MKKALMFFLIFLVACAPVAPPQKVMRAPGAPSEANVQTKEEITAPAQPNPPQPVETTPGTPLQPTGHKIDPYSQIGCEQLLSAEEFAQPCGKTADNLVVTYKIGTKNCFVNIKDRQNELLTAGVTLTGFADSAAAAYEFDRRLKVLQVGADKSVGERAYTTPFAMVNRETVDFLRGEYIIEVGSDTRLCSKDGLLAVARAVDKNLT